MRTTDRSAAHRTARLAGTALVLLALLTGCLGDDAASNDPEANDPTVTNPGAEPVTDGTGELEDGEHQGRLVELSADAVTVARVRLLSGDEAAQAAEADGTEHDLDFYLQDLGERVTLPFADDVEAQIYDCTGACEQVDTTIAALATGDAVPYGGAAAVVALTVEDGEVVALSEVYLP
jgi:hypothetical protein